MLFGNGFKNNWVLAAAAAAILSVCISQSAFAGSLVGWGYNLYGQVDPPAGNDYVAVAAGEYYGLPLKSNGSIVGWGRNNYGQATPPAGNDYVAIAAGGYHSLAIAECQYALVGDMNDDCKVDFRDFALMAANWLIDCSLTPGNPACVPK